MLHPPNLIMRPGPETVGLEDLIKSIPKGLAFIDGSVTMDFQAKNGICSGTVREITNGKLGAVIQNAGLLFKASELWNNLTTIGGAESAEARVTESKKGEPLQTTLYTVSAVPFVVKASTVIDVKRRA
jgi:hypothetical protein